LIDLGEDVRKPSHGWSTGNQGGFRPPSRVRQIYKAPERTSGDITIRQAASKNFRIKIRCKVPNCLHEIVEYAPNFMVNHPSEADKTIAQIAPNLKCTACCKKGAASVKFLT
jgi:hypothetical protein